MHGFVGVHGRGACMAECILVSTESSSPAVLALPPCRTTKHLKYGCALEINVGPLKKTNILMEINLVIR